VDGAGNAYVAGSTESTNFPTTPGAFQTLCNGPNSTSSCGDVFVAKINPSGSALVYSTYLGGGRFDGGNGIAVDSAGNAYVTGTTDSSDFPTKNALQPTYSGGPFDAFVAKISPSGSALVYSTYLGGSGNEYGEGIAVDSAGRAYVKGVTTSTNFPTKNPLQAANAGGANDAFVAKLNSAGSALVYSTYLGGSDYDGSPDFRGGIAVDGVGNAYVTGSTLSTDFPTKNPLQAANGGIWDAFVTKINPTGSALVYSTYIGGSSDEFGGSIAVDSAGSAYITGTKFYGNCTEPCVLKSDAFVYKLNSAGSALVYATHVGAGSHNSGQGIAVDSSDNAYIIGVSFYLTITRVFAAKVSPSGSAVGSLPYLGGNEGAYGHGVAADVLPDHVYVTGYTQSTNFPILHPLQRANAGFFDAFIAKIDMGIVTTTTLSSSLNPSTYGQAVTFSAVVTSSLGSPPDGETVTFMKGTTVLGTGSLSGGSASFTTSTLPVGTYGITAVYGGDSNLAGSKSKALSQVVSKATTTTTLVSSQNPSNFGQSVTFTASVTPQFSGAVTGNVTFYDGTTALKTISLSGGVAKFTTSTLTTGSHTITATYNGSYSFDGSSASLTQKVN
jgi:hypothetical protein